MEPLTFDTPNGLLAQVEIPSGTLAVETSDSARTELIFNRVKNPKDLQVRLDEAGKGHRLTVTYKGPKFGLFTGADIDLTLRCPRGTRVEMASGSADLSVRGTIGAIDFKTGSGDVSFHDADGDVRVKVGSGDVHGSRVGGGLTMLGASGDVDVDSVAGDTVVKTASGDVQIAAIDGDVTLTSVSGDVQIGSLRQGRTQIRSVSGDVQIGVAAGTEVFLDVSATSGDARSDLAMVDAPDGGGPMLELKVATVSGDITIRRTAARDRL
jgi:DUF4097 and DUF4098 domain-containing protein YvlB